MKIAICNYGNKNWWQNLMIMIENQTNIEFYVDYYEDSIGIIKKINNGINYNIIFWDMSAEINWCIDFAQQIRKTPHAADTLICFSVVCVPIIASKIYQINPLAFYNMIYAEQEILEIILYYYQNILEEASFKYKKNKTVFSIQFSTIVYLESHHKKIIIHTVEEQYEFRETMKSLESNFLCRHFIQPHKSYIVNLNFCESYTKNDIFLHNGAVIPISQSKSKDTLVRLETKVK